MPVTLLCPVRTCHAPLAREERRFVCVNAHSFDVARSGYVNLLQPQDRRSKTPGDTNEAVQARRRFLDRGFVDAITARIVALLPLRSGQTLLEAGCGEGHHLAAFRQAYDVEAHGTDLSVPAIELAAKRHRHCFFTVANADRFLPYADGAFDAVASITARLNVEEFRRVCAGSLLLVIPGADDLLELREAVLGERIERDRVERTIALFSPRFRLVKHETIRHAALLDREAMIDVMSSSYRGLRSRERERLEALEPMPVTFSRDALIFE
ncbi:MAG TPA: methyltransferase domain-containing protein [Thermoanaerobaculia bacterium]|nr:methyltransferase domain-containing protein [Thermoanaerobaculia bacterium]